MKKLISILLIVASVSVVFAKDDGKWDSVKESFKSAGTSIKEAAKESGKAIKEDVKEATSGKGEELKENLKNTMQEASKNISDAAKNLSENISETTKKNSTITATGTLKQGLFSKTKFTLKTKDGDSYTLKTFSDNEDSYKKLSGFKNQTIVVTGVLDKETNTIKMTSYRSLNNDDKNTATEVAN